MKLPISVIILTYNEELNIENCLESVVNWVNEIIVVDSFSNDKTLEIVKKYTKKIVQRTFVNQAEQFNWALDNLEIKNEWVLRLDADERMTDDLWREIDVVLSKAPEDISGYYIKRRLYFMDRWIKHGGYYPTWFLRLFKKGKGKSELREVDEHVVLSEGKAKKIKNDFIHDDKKNLELWINRQNNFSSREINQMLKEKKDSGVKANSLGVLAEKRHWLRENFYYRLPLFSRSLLYFIYRYFFCLGFLDGKEGLIYHFLQGFWHRFLLDSKIYEYKKKSEKD